MADQRTSAPLAAPGHAAQALAELFLHDADRFDGAGRRLAETHYSVDIPITGNSMGTALPNGTVIRVALGDGASCRVGDVVVFRQHEKVVAHRALAHARRHLITRGDARFAPDQPVEFACVLGRVSGVVVSTSTLLLPAIRRRHWLVRLVNFFAVGTTVLALRISPTLAGHWVGFLTWIERHMPTAPPPRGVMPI